MHKSEEKQHDEENVLEKTKLRFEFFKHLTTLTTATAIILIAVYRESLSNPKADNLVLVAALSVTLLGIGVSLFLSLYGMLRLIALLDLSLEIPEERKEAKRIATRLDWMQRMVVTNFAAALLAFCLFTFIASVPILRDWIFQ